MIVIGADVIELLGVNGLQDREYPHGAKILWGKPVRTVEQWDEIATWGIEYFGLPGDRYITNTTVDHMIWWFKDPRDQTIFLLRNGQAKCIELSSNT